MFKRLNTKFFLIPLSLFLVISSYIFINFYSFYKAEQPLWDKVLSDPLISVLENKEEYIIQVANTNPATNFIFVSGGLVEEKAYIHNLAEIAKINNIRIYVPKIFLKLAIFDQGAIDRVIKLHKLTNYYVGGHSLGGVVACYHTRKNPETTKGLILMGSYCDEDIKAYKGQVLSMVGSEDKLMNGNTRTEKNKNLPQQAIIQTIQGMNHAQFGSYGKQRGDGEAIENNYDSLTKVVLLTYNIKWNQE
jgi:Alpha/beta hydrolase family